ncbi:MAG: PAS domain S-box protein [Deltaproteobacteria bacterium]|nr:PAS domain S-box protein [Deltaproteobacteria bacterium]
MKGVGKNKNESNNLRKRKSEEKHEALFNNAQIALFRTGILDGKILEINERYANLAGYSNIEDCMAEFNAADAWVDPDARGELVRILEENGFVNDYDTEIIRKDGTHIWISFSATIFHEQGFIEGSIVDINDRKLAETALHESKTKYRNLFEQMPQGAFRQRADGRLLDVNPAALRMLGLTKEAFLGRTSETLLCDIICEDGTPFPGHKHPSMVALRTGKPVSGVVAGVLNERTKKRIWLELNAIPEFRSGEDKPFQAMLTMHDLTDQKQTQVRLKESEDKFKNFAEQSIVGIYLVSNGVFKYVNPKFANIFGYTVDECLNNMHLGQLVHPEDVPIAEEQVRKRLSGESDAVQYSIRAHKKKGREIRVEVFGASIFRNGKRAAMGTVLDITEKEEAEEALKESKERFELAMKFANDGLFDWNLETNTVYYSPGWKQMLGYEDHEIKHEFSEWERLTKPGDIKATWAIMNELLDGKRNGYKTEFQMRHKAGHWVDILARANAVYDENGKAIRVVGTHVDITERKKMETQLQQSQKMEAMGTLAGGIAHDFNNILFPIVGYAEMISEDLAPDSVTYAHINLILESAIHARALVKQILTFSRQRKQELKPLKADIIIRETLKLMRSSLPSTIELNQNVAKDCGLIMADPTEIHQIVMNLCTNAYHAMEDAGGRLDVRLNRVELTSEQIPDLHMPPGPYLYLSVSDTGAGMDAEVLKRIFDPYYTTKKKGKGTGLGLSVVHGIVHHYGGEIHVQSDGKGSVFKVFLPLIKSENKTFEIESDSNIPKGHGKILLVDDEAYILNLEEQMLTRLGYEVTSYTSSSEALLAFRRTPETFDLVISDVTMPGITGDKLAIEMMKVRPDIPIILCTGYSEKITQEKILSLGIMGFLLKPVQKKAFAEKIREVLDD